MANWPRRRGASSDSCRKPPALGGYTIGSGGGSPYGEWLRTENRSTNVREQLKSGHDQLSDIGMEAFAERARRELLAAGGTTVRRKTAGTARTLSSLTAQEGQIARLAAEGHSNPQIGAQLFVSARTVEH